MHTDKKSVFVATFASGITQRVEKPIAEIKGIREAPLMLIALQNHRPLHEHVVPARYDYLSGKRYPPETESRCFVQHTRSPDAKDPLNRIQPSK